MAKPRSYAKLLPGEVRIGRLESAVLPSWLSKSVEGGDWRLDKLLIGGRRFESNQRRLAYIQVTCCLEDQWST